MYIIQGKICSFGIGFSSFPLFSLDFFLLLHENPTPRFLAFFPATHLHLCAANAKSSYLHRARVTCLLYRREKIAKIQYVIKMLISQPTHTLSRSLTAWNFSPRFFPSLTRCDGSLCFPGKKALTVIAFAGFEVFSVENFWCARIQQRINEKKKRLTCCSMSCTLSFNPISRVETRPTVRTCRKELVDVFYFVFERARSS